MLVKPEMEVAVEVWLDRRTEPCRVGGLKCIEYQDVVADGEPAQSTQDTPTIIKPGPNPLFVYCL